MRKRASRPGSSSSTEDRLYPVGRLGRPHGLEGFLGLYVEPENLVYFEAGSQLRVGGISHRVESVRRTDKGYQVRFAGVADREQAESLRGAEVQSTWRRSLRPDEFWPEDLIGLEVRPAGGRVVAVEQGSAQDRLVVERTEGRFEIPFVGELVPNVDLDAGFIEILELPGLIEP